jgi:putative lipoic acid-binding regulatory protein
VNTYPCTRSFQAIGVSDGTGAFKADILGAVQSVVGQVHVECINERPSSGGKYTAVRIGPVHVQSGDQVRGGAAENASARRQWQQHSHAHDCAQQGLAGPRATKTGRRLQAVGFGGR